MDRTDYQRLLLKHAVHAMACDGEVHPDEVSEVRRLVDTTPYFEDVDVGEEMDATVATLRADGAGEVRSGVAALAGADLNRVQKLRVLEVLLSVVSADRVVGDEERSYVGAVREALGLTTADLVTRFPTDLGVLMSPPTGEFGEAAGHQGHASFDIEGLDALVL